MKTFLTIAALSLGLATQASAHATFAESEAVQGQTARFTLRVPHGCSGEATLRVRVSIPDGLARAQPMVHAGWELETVTGPLAQPYTAHGTTFSEGVREIIWSGELPAEYYDEFVFRAAVTDLLEAGETLYIPVVQECANGAARWIEIPAEGQDPHDLAEPAPGVMIVAPAEHGHGH
ncbi:DUF1775 domain-containing protein [Rhodobacter sp. NTK016B]|uniref:YcnI family copper-binding membrane protein n=1 Tax=Rhodobacter sp. NTK016B TaxID=2759676 RepID=UPI001A8E113C|nr:DUF1775 domain-containing protein [Rhodobacter sp. NTK016B]MBN8294833.1 DUF1775 domain-containing protein [Rhodobacter sp. NTK016B]